MESEPIANTPLTPLSYLLRSATVWADRPAVTYRDRTKSYEDHLAGVGRIVTVLRDKLKVRPGDHVAVVLPNVPAMLELHYAVPATGAVLVPLNTRLSAPEYAYILEHCECHLLLAHEGVQEQVSGALKILGSEAPSVLWITELPDGEWEMMLRGVNVSPLERPVDENSLLSINYTSGTTGRPKGVMTTHRGAYLHALGVIAESRLQADSVYLWSLPMFHCNGWAFPWAVTAAGGNHVLLEKVDPHLAWELIRRHKVTHMCAAPTVLVMLLECPDASPLEEPVTLFLGGAPPSPALLERASALNIAITHLYGLTETYGPIAVCAWNPEWDRLGDSEKARLRARQGVATVVSERLRVVRDDMTDVPPDGRSVGEIVMRGNNVMTGYYKDPAATAQAFRGGWFHSGDLGVMHSDRRIEVTDRLKDVIISGGENIASVEVEQAIEAHPSVAEAAVVGISDEKWGQAVVAYVVPRGGVPPDTGDLLRFLRGRLAGFKLPKRIHVVDALPKTATGKIQKYQLREQVTVEIGDGKAEPEGS